MTIETCRATLCGMTRVVRCPHCGGVASFTPENKFRPFCSERCKLIDLGKWASEDYKVPLENQNPDADDYPDDDADESQEQSEITREDEN